MAWVNGINKSGLLQLDSAEGQAQAARLQQQYRQAAPFPHIVIDGFLSEELAHRLIENFPAPNLASVQRFSDHQFLKRGYRPDSLGEHASAELLRALNSQPMVDLMQALTGHPRLASDPDFVGGGYHEIERGGHLDIHADFNLHPKTALVRRINLILFLNPTWEEHWDGALELWERDMSACAVKVTPIFNRAVVFDTSKTSFHGHPSSLKTPKSVTRRSLALYFYSDQTPQDSAIDQRTDWQQRPGIGAFAERSVSALRRYLRVKI